MLPRLLYCLCICCVCCISVDGQITYRLQLLSDDVTYQVSIVPETTYTSPDNKTSSAQVTIRVPHGQGDYRFVTTAFQSLVTGADWEQNARTDRPAEAPDWDYVSFALSSRGVEAYNYQTGVEIPIFSFQNGGIACVDSIELMRSDDIFLPPNSENANVGNYISIAGAGLVNAYTSNVGTGRALCTPQPSCELTTKQNVDLCVGETYQGQAFERDTTYETHHISVMGCDSIVSHRLTIHADQLDMQQLVLCEGEIYQGQTFERDTLVRIDFVSQYGCDSVILAQITIAPSYEDTIQVTIPRGATYEGVAYEMDEEVTLRYQSVEGCDSIVVVQLQVTDVPTVVTEIEICAGESYENVIYENSTTLLDTIWTDDGAMDKILVTNILVLPTYEINKDTTLCRGESFAGIVMEESNIFVEEWQTTSGCDSLVVTDITVLEQYETEQFVTICERESYEGMTYLRDTSFTQTYLSQHGCDSLVTHYVTVLNQPTIPLAATQFICHVDELPLTLDAGDYATYQWSTGATERTIAVTTPGQYALSVTTQNGCRDSTVVDLRLSDLSVSVAVDAESCDSDALHQIAIDVMDGEAPFIYSINGGEAFETTSVFEQLQTGTYEIVVEDVGGCRAEQIIKIQPNENVLLVLPDELQVNLGDSIVIRARTDATTIDSIRWTPTAGLSCNDCLQPTAQPDTDQTYTLTVYTGEGCQVEQEVTIYVNKSSQYYAPTAFSPNDDGQNDLFTIYAGSSVKRIIAFKLYDRWGSLLYERSELDPRSEDDHWDGKVNGQPAAAGAYMYTAILELVDGRTEPIGGELILSR